jgi:microcystin-dependent protein
MRDLPELMAYRRTVLSEITLFSSNFAPKGRALCNGQLLPINLQLAARPC